MNDNCKHTVMDSIYTPYFVFSNPTDSNNFENFFLIKRSLYKYGYDVSNIGSNICLFPYLIIDCNGKKGKCLLTADPNAEKFARYAETDIEKFLQKAAELMGVDNPTSNKTHNSVYQINNVLIDVPEGMECYMDGNLVKFKPISNKKSITMTDVYKELFSKEAWRLCEFGIEKYNDNALKWNCSSNCVSKTQAQKLEAFNKLMIVAKYLNGDWKPNWKNWYEDKFYFHSDGCSLEVGTETSKNHGSIYFKSKELIKQAIEILGMETIKLAINTDY